MIVNKTGNIFDAFHVTGLAWSPSYLIDCASPALFEAGFTAAGRLYLEDIRRVLGDRSPSVLFLTHVHYDHCGAAAFLKRAFPGMAIAASSRAAVTIGRPNAVDLMRTLSARVVPLLAGHGGIDRSKVLDEPFETFPIDMILKEGDVIDLEDGVHVHVLATPGHTRDLLSYHVPELKLLIASEAAGCLDSQGMVQPEFLVDYDLYLASLKRLASLDVDVLCLAHLSVIVGKEEVRNFFARSVSETESFRTRAETVLRQEGGSVERTVRRLKEEQWDSNPGVKQPEAAYVLNLTTRVEHLAARALLDGAGVETG